MEINTYLYLIISLIIIFFIFIIKQKKQKKYINGKKIANTSIIRETTYFKNILKKYKFYVLLSSMCLVLAIVSCSILSGRVVEKSYNEESNDSRDIILCMDVSNSTNELNYNLIKSIKSIVSELNGEKFGIVVFSTSAYLSLPITDDYEYINELLDEYEDAFSVINSSYSSSNGKSKLKASSFVTAGTTANSDERGYSLIGDGLASCMYDFPDLETEEKSRIIILSTDNELYGTPYLTTLEAAKLCKENNVTVYAISPYLIQANDEINLKRSAEMTGGKYYKVSSSNTVSNIVNEINKLERIDSTGNTQLSLTDNPTIPFMLVVLFATLFFIFEKKVM